MDASSRSHLHRRLQSLGGTLRTRLAPTPSGYLHWGNAFSFVLTWLLARSQGGTIVLRIDDLDRERCRPEYVEDIFRSLDWLGLDYDDGPVGPDDFQRRYSQRHRMDLYRQVLDELDRRGIVFGCACSRTSIQRDTPDARHPKTCRQRGLGLDAANVCWRVATAAASPVSWRDMDECPRSVDLHETMRDFVVRRRDRVPAYQLASLADDLHFGINLVVRGQDLVDSTAAQLWLAQSIDASRFSTVSLFHHALVTHDGQKLSKSAGTTSLRASRETGETSVDLYRRLSPLFGFSQQVSSADEALAAWVSSDAP